LSKYDELFIQLIQNNPAIMQDLTLVRELNLPDCYIAAGYVRNYIWDHLHGYPSRTPLNDIDVIYYDPKEADEETERRIESVLQQNTDSSLWSVKNQARMHVRNGDQPYHSSEDAIHHWPETVTAVGIKLENEQSISFISPYGLEDIFEFNVRKSPLFKDPAYYQTRVNNKNWQALWPKLKIISVES
jgi:hypothetical protein